MSTKTPEHTIYGTDSDDDSSWYPMCGICATGAPDWQPPAKDIQEIDPELNDLAFQTGEKFFMGEMRSGRTGEHYHVFWLETAQGIRHVFQRFTHLQRFIAERD